jgi:hypothetical protein
LKTLFVTKQGFLFLRERWQRKSAVEPSATAIEANSATELNANSFVTTYKLNEGTPKGRKKY